MPPLRAERLASEFTRPVLTVEQHLNTPPFAQVTTLHAVQPRVPDVDLVEPELLEPQPWDEAYRQQKFFGKLALGLLCLALGLLAAGAGHPLAFAAYFVAQFVNRRKAKKVLDIKESHGVDVEQERKRLKRSNIALGGAAVASVAVAVVVAVMTILLFLLILGAIIGFFLRFSHSGSCYFDVLSLICSSNDSFSTNRVMSGGSSRSMALRSPWSRLMQSLIKSM